MDPFIGEIRAVAFNYVPEGWVSCSGQLLQTSQYQALYALLGTTFGGNGSSTFGVPDLRGRSVIGVGVGPGLVPISWGEKVGASQTQIQVSNMPPHTHTATVSDPGHLHAAPLPPHTHPFAVPCAPDTTPATSISPVGNILCSTQAMQNAIASGPVGADPGPLPLYTAPPPSAGATAMAGGTTGPASATGASSTGASVTGISVINSQTGGGNALSTQSPAQGLYYIIATTGIWPPRQ